MPGYMHQERNKLGAEMPEEELTWVSEEPASQMARMTRVVQGWVSVRLGLLGQSALSWGSWAFPLTPELPEEATVQRLRDASGS